MAFSHHFVFPWINVGGGFKLKTQCRQRRQTYSCEKNDKREEFCCLSLELPK